MRKSMILMIAFMLLLTGCGSEPPINSSPETEQPMDSTTEAPTTEEPTTEPPTELPTEPPIPDVKELYKDYFLENYALTDLVCIADVTHDGIEDMIVIQQDSTEETVYSGYVYTVLDSTVIKIFEKGGTTAYIGGFFNWYLVEDGENWNLAEEYFDMWQGHGETGFRQYYLSNSGEETEVSRVCVPASDSEKEADGTVKAEAFDAYVTKLDKEIEKSYRMFFSRSESSAQPKQIETDPAIIFRIDLKKPEALSYKASIGKITTETKMWFQVGSDSYRELSVGENVTILYENNDRYDPAYFIEAGGAYGYVFIDAVSKTGETVSLETTDYFEPLAQYLYASFYNDANLAYTNLFSYDINDTLASGDEWSPYVRVENANTRDDLLDVIHERYSAAYDNYDRCRGSVMECLFDEERGIFTEQDGKVYMFQLEGNWNTLDYLSAEYQKTEGNEVWISMKAAWSDTLTFDFSMLLENGVWKVGAATYPR